MRISKFLLISLLVMVINNVYSQNSKVAGIKTIISAIDTFSKHLPGEKLFLQLDKPYYTPGDTIWYKAYLLNSDLSSSSLSGLLYVELISDSSKVIKRQMLKVAYGVAWGDIVLKTNLYPGSYTLRAYTNWMRNFGEERFFSRQLYIGAARKDSWLVNTEVTTTKDLLKVDLKFSDASRKAVGSQEMRLRISDGKSIFNREQVITDSDGKLAINLALPEKEKRKELTIMAEDLRQVKGADHHKVLIPIRLNRPEYTDLQFMPEGGALLSGLPIRVGFKAIGEDGKGVALSGKVYSNSSGSEAVADFNSLYKGMGSFELTPKAGERYTAKVILADGTEKSYLLPDVKDSGIGLQVQNPPDRDSITFTIQATADIAVRPGNYFLIGMAHGKVCYGASVLFQGKTIIRRKISKKLFPTGLVKFTLFAEGNRPLTERIVFIDHQDQLKISLAASRESTSAGDSIALNILVKDKIGNPVEGSFSLAITDDRQVKADNPHAGNVLSYMFLNNDLKGSIEDPGYYFEKQDQQRAEHLDNLMLTQGWTNYNIKEIGDWEQIFRPVAMPEYAAEEQFKVTGRVSNVILNSPLSNLKVSLISLRKPSFFLNTVTDKQGRFEFNAFHKLDTIAFRIQALNKKDKDINVDMQVDAFIPAGFTLQAMPPIPWNVNSDTAMIGYIEKSVEQKEEAERMIKLLQGELLKKVVIKGQKPEERGKLAYSLNEEEIRNARTDEKVVTLMELYYQPRKIFWGWVITVDGRRVPDSWLATHTTEDIRNMTVRIMPPPPSVGGGMPTAQIKIISNRGKGSPEIGKTGIYFYRPMPMSWPHQFYNPHYTGKEDKPKNLRSTVFWEPNIVTDASGKATLSFFPSASEAPYTLIIQGADLNGKVGYLQQKLVLTKNSAVLSK